MADYFHYEPSFYLAIAFYSLFALSLSVHFYQLATTRLWFFLPFLLGCLCEASAFIGRAMSAKEAPYYTYGIGVIQDQLLLLGPTFYSAAIYMLLGRFIKYLDGDRFVLIKTKYLTKIFLLGDIASIALQALDLGKTEDSGPEDNLTLAEYAMFAGLIVQLVFFCMFIVVTGNFHYRFANNSTTQPPNWQKFMTVIYSASMLILIRSVFRMVEYAEGHDGMLLSMEVFVYVLDIIPMAIVTINFHIFHPSKYMQSREKTLTKADSEISLASPSCCKCGN